MGCQCKSGPGKIHEVILVYYNTDLIILPLKIAHIPFYSYFILLSNMLLLSFVLVFCFFFVFFFFPFVFSEKPFWDENRVVCMYVCMYPP